MQMDIPETKDLHIKGKIKTKNQKYWSITVYNEYGIPLPQIVFDENVHKQPRKNEPDAYDYDVVITSSMGLQSNTKGITTIDISERPEMRKGYVLFRLVHPSNPIEEVEQYSTPVVEISPTTSKESRKRK